MSAEPPFDGSSPPEASPDESLRAAVPGLVRIAVGAWWRTAGWTVGITIRTGSRVIHAAVSGQSAAELLQESGADIREYLRRLLGLIDAEVTVDGEAPSTAETEEGGVPLRERGAELLRRSADVDYEEDAHPAYERIVGQLAPDDGRILRLLAIEGPQPAVDVRARKAMGMSSELVAPGLTMIGEQAGCRYLDRVPAYLNNLYRLGLVWFSREPLTDPLRYQVLEAQPDVTEAMSEAGRGRTVRRSIHLTPFGEDFCEVCLPLGADEPEEPAPAAPDGRQEAPSPEARPARSGGGRRTQRPRPRAT